MYGFKNRLAKDTIRPWAGEAVRMLIGPGLRPAGQMFT